jgi:hypothetical protein
MEGLMIYDFSSVKTSRRLWENLGRLAGVPLGGALILRSVFLTGQGDRRRIEKNRGLIGENRFVNNAP